MKAIFLSLPLFFLVVMACSCKQKKSTTQDQPEKKKEFLPLTEFLSGELQRIDTVPYSLEKYTTVNNLTDSSFINRQQLKAMTAEFLEINIGDEEHIKYYDETSFFDTTTGTASFTYISNSPKTKLSRADVYVNTETQKINRLYLIRNYNNGDTVVSKQLLWQTSGNFIIITSKTVNNNEITIQEKVVWDEKEGK